jgi:hypothetical protein
LRETGRRSGLPDRIFSHRSNVVNTNSRPLLNRF